MTSIYNIFHYLDLRSKIRANTIKSINDYVDSGDINPFKFHLTETVFISSILAFVSYFWSQYVTDPIIDEFFNEHLGLINGIDSYIKNTLKVQSLVFSCFSAFFMFLSVFITSIFFSRPREGLRGIRLRKMLHFYHGSYKTLSSICFSIVLLIYMNLIMCNMIIETFDPSITLNDQGIPDIIYRYWKKYVSSNFLGLILLVSAFFGGLLLLASYIIDAPLFISKAINREFGLVRKILHGITWISSVFLLHYFVFLMSFQAGIFWNHSIIPNSTGEWRVYNSFDGQFSVKLPHKPRQDVGRVSRLSDDNYSPVKEMKLLTGKDGKLDFSFKVQWITSKFIPSEFNSRVENMVNEISKSSISVSIDTLENEYRTLIDLEGDYSILSSTRIIDSTMYFLEVISFDESIESKQLTMFFESFTVSY